MIHIRSAVRVWERRVGLPDNAWSVGAIFVLIAAMTLLVGLRVHNGDDADESKPLYRVMNIWVWLVLVMLVAGGIGFAAFLTLTPQLH
jgi:hypothetical protein